MCESIKMSRKLLMRLILDCVEKVTSNALACKIERELQKQIQVENQGA